MVPPTARSAVEPVFNADERSTDMVPRTTQKPCETSVTSASRTANANPSAPRTLFWNQTDRRLIAPDRDPLRGGQRPDDHVGVFPAQQPVQQRAGIRGGGVRYHLTGEVGGVAELMHQRRRQLGPTARLDPLRGASGPRFPANASR